MRNTKIVCTIGPASEHPKMLEKLIKARMNVARLNFYHEDKEEHISHIRNIRQTSGKLGKLVAILLDTKGPDIRTHSMEGGAMEIKKDYEIIVEMEEVTCNSEKFSIT